MDKLVSAADFFSLKLLVRTLFSPFRQISAGEVDGGLDVRIQAAMDRLVSRMVGFVVRIFILIFGGALIVVEAALGLIVMVAWPVVPFLPVVGVVMMIMGVTI